MGAHFGFYTLIAAVRVGSQGTVLSFEPSTYNFKVLRLNVLINGLKNVKLFKIALANQSGIAYLGIPKGRMTGEDTLAIEPPLAERGEYVKLERFDNIATHLSINKVDVVKIDVEGAEYLVLEGFGEYLDKCRHIILEVHPEKMIKLKHDPRDLYKLLERHGFELYLLDERRGVVPLKCYRLHTLKQRHHLVATHNSEEVCEVRSKLRQYNLTSPDSLNLRCKVLVYFNVVSSIILGRCHES